MNLSALDVDGKLLLRRLEDLSGIAESKGITRFSFFLDERQTLIAKEYISQARLENAMLFGGYEGAARKVCGFFPIYGTPDESAFPVAAFTAKYPADISLLHRDFLGALMGLGIKRESIGDIVTAQGECTFFVLESVSAFVLSGLEKVGSAGISLSPGTGGALEKEPEYIEVRGTVGSARLDSLVKLATGLSREKAATLIKGGVVRRNHTETKNVSEGFSPGDTLSIRGYGRFIVDSVGEPTRKGRLPVLIKKFV